MRSRIFAPAEPAVQRLQRGYLAMLGSIERHARIYFRHVHCPQTKAEAVAECVALGWLWYLRLARQGKDASAFPMALASFAARAVRSGRRLCGQLKSRDALSALAQQRHHFVVGKLPDFSTLMTNPLEEALTDNTQSPVLEQVCFRCDFPRWRHRYRARDRRVIDDLMRGERTKDVAEKHHLSPGRVSQLRRQFHDDWQAFGAAPGAEGSSPPPVRRPGRAARGR